MVDTIKPMVEAAIVMAKKVPRKLVSVAKTYPKTVGALAIIGIATWTNHTAWWSVPTMPKLTADPVTEAEMVGLASMMKELATKKDVAELKEMLERMAKTLPSPITTGSTNTRPRK